ncbi:MAG: DinB family protein [Candidatus Dormibacteraceae bacterium]
MTTIPTGERADLLETLATHRAFLRHTVRGLTREQLSQRTTVSELCLGGLIKHVTAVERQWTGFISRGAEALGGFDEAGMTAHARQFQIEPGDTPEALLGEYDAVASTTAELIGGLPDLDASHALPEAPWFRPGARWSARRALLHILAETSQHAGHADIIREALDGQKTMG